MRRPFRVLVLAVLLAFLVAPAVLAVREFGSAYGKSSTPRVVLATKLPTEIPVLCYHGIGTPSPVADSVGYYNVTERNFE